MTKPVTPADLLTDIDDYERRIEVLERVIAGGLVGPPGPQGPAGSGAEPRYTQTFSTIQTVTPNTEINVDVTMQKSAIAYWIQTTVPARVRAYSRASYRTADVARSIDDDPELASDHGLLMEIATGAELLSMSLVPAVHLYNRDVSTSNIIYFRIENRGATAIPIGTTLVLQREE